MNTLWGGKALEESRLSLWTAAANIVADFPLWGTGYGTYQYVDPLYRTNAHLANFIVDHPHNDYLELLVESGSAGLLLGTLAIALVFRLAYQFIRKGNSRAGLALGALFAFASLVIHCFGDFEVHVPAITLLAAVLCTRLCALSQRRVHAEELTVLRSASERALQAPLGRVGSCVRSSYLRGPGTDRFQRRLQGA